MTGQASFDFDRRDEALDLLAKYRTELVEAARAFALHLAHEHGRVTSPQVIRAMRDAGWGSRLDQVDARFMGAVFRKGWERIGYEPGGSHARPVSIWKRIKE